MLNEHPMDRMRRKALRWCKQHKLPNGNTIYGNLKQEYGAVAAGNLLYLIDYIVNETAKEVIFAEPKEYKEINGKRALVVPKAKFKILTQLAGFNTAGLMVRHHKTGEYIKVDDIVGIVPNPKGKGAWILTDTIDLIEWALQKEESGEGPGT